MIKKDGVKGFVLGVCTALTVAGAATAFAQNIDVTMGGIRLFWDGVEKTLTDANGKKVEPILYEGTTYVPARAIAELAGKKVDWNHSEMSVYMGTKPTMRTIPLADMQKNINGNDSCYRKNYTFKLKNEEIKCNDCLQVYRGKSVMYVLDGQYSRFTGKMVMPYSIVGEEGENDITFYSVENDGTENEIDSFHLKKTQEPITIDINLRGVKNLKIAAKNNDDVIIYDASFLGE